MNGPFTEEVISQISAVPGANNQAIDPATIMIVFTLLKELVAFCAGRGASVEAIAVSLARPTLGQRIKFRWSLWWRMGNRKYRSLGGDRYADKVLSVGRVAPMRERIGFANEVTVMVN